MTISARFDKLTCPPTFLGVAVLETGGGVGVTTVAVATVVEGLGVVAVLLFSGGACWGLLSRLPDPGLPFPAKVGTNLHQRKFHLQAAVVGSTIVHVALVGDVQGSQQDV